MELFDFPFDCQDLTLYLRFGRYEDRIALRQLPMDFKNHAVDVLPSVMLNEYGVGMPRMHLMYVPVFAVGKVLQYDAVALAQVTVTRRHESYTHRTGAIAAVLPIMAMFSHSVPNLGDKLSINITLLLTLATVVFAQGDHLPKVPYLTLLDKYMLMCFFVICGLCVVSFVAEQLSPDEFAEEFSM